MATLQNLQARIAKLQAQAESIVKKDSTAVIAKIHDLMEKHGLTTADINAHISGGKKRGRKLGVKAAAKSAAPAATYRDPKTGATWSGRGRAPGWIANAKNRSKYLVEGNGIGVPAAKKAVKAGNYVRGVQPALYVDPKTGATWSGRGRAPAWIAGAKDRSKFLITGATGATAESKTTVAKKAAAKKVATKKAVAKKSVGEKIAAATKKVAAKKIAVTKPAAKKVVAKKVSASAPAVTVIPEAASETTSASAV
ncbi:MULTISPECIES: H-NS family nucleoid-associated regulatory protein [Paraburkholderia]|uniref:H-NS family nucleoid-associated regulatory protein n=1 Tax=Paraburkholderia TaxID=1822464 RepID=UPI0038B91A70